MRGLVVLLCLLITSNSYAVKVYLNIPEVKRIKSECFLVDQVDLIELNHCYDKMGKLKFDQLIFWEIVYDELLETSFFRVVDWRMLPKSYREQLTKEEYFKKNNEFIKEYTKKYPNVEYVPPYTPKWLGGPMCPHKNYKTGMYEVVFFDKHSKVKRKIFSISFNETWTQKDPELIDRQYYAETAPRRKLKYLDRHKNSNANSGGGFIPLGAKININQ